MKSLGNGEVKLTKITQYNRYMFILLAINILVYTSQVNFSENALTGFLLVTAWTGLIIFLLINEAIRKIIKKTTLVTPEANFALIKIISTTSAVLISVLTLTTGNTGLMFLYIVPIIIALFYSQSKLSVILLTFGIASMFIAESSGWFESSLLIENQHQMSFSLVFATNLALISLLGLVFSRQIKINGEKAHLFHNMATTDALTGLLNRREFNKRIVEEVSRSQRHKSALSYAIFDIDFFKKINDTYGHHIGDCILKEIGELIKNNIRDCDIVARYGGEEFSLILPETNQNQGFELLERLRTTIEENVFCKTTCPINASISVGIAQFDPRDKNAQDLCERADQALYRAKRNGRNCVEHARVDMPKLEITPIKVANS